MGRERYSDPGERAQRERLPGPTKGRYGLGGDAHRAGHVCGYGVPYQAAVPSWRDPRPHPTKLDERGEAHLIALACSEAPPGHDHWTLRLLANKVVELGLAPSMSHEGIRKRLKKTVSSRGRRRSGVFPR